MNEHLLRNMGMSEKELDKLLRAALFADLPGEIMKEVFEEKLEDL